MRNHHSRAAKLWSWLLLFRTRKATILDFCCRQFIVQWAIFKYLTKIKKAESFSKYPAEQLSLEVTVPGCTLYYLLREQDVISEQGGEKISFST